ncbi:TPA: phage polarity suppression protein [Citrobacter gillenii]
MARALLEQAFETCQKNKSDWMNGKSALARAEMALKELELTCTRYEPEAAQALRDDIDLKIWAVNQSAGQYIRSHEAVQRISIRRQLHAFMQVNGDALAVHVTRGGNIDYAEEDRDILTTIGFRPDRASRDDNRAKYTPEQSQIFMHRQAVQTRKKST